MNPLILCFNGPPRAGKDTAAYITEEWCVKHGLGTPDRRKLTGPMDAALPHLLGMTQEEYAYYREEAKDEQLPDMPEGTTLRRILQHLSENGIKPVCGIEHFGRVAGKSLVHDWSLSSGRSSYVTLFTDTGFQIEYNALKRALLRDTGIFDAKVKLVRVGRPGHSYAGDTREDVTDPGSPHTMLWNSKTKDDFRVQVFSFLDEHMPGWLGL